MSPKEEGMDAEDAKTPDAPHESLIHSKQELLEENTPVLLLQEYDLIIRGNL